jgi:hypothetical protein
VRLAAQIAKPDEERGIDIGYRGRSLLPYMGKGAREKAEIGTGFSERARGSGLRLDIAVDEKSRIYGDKWFEFLADCRAVLGTEAGVSIFDLDDVVQAEYERLVADNPAIGFDELAERLLNAWEDNIYYRTVSPRHFEAAALRVCQILFEGKYSGVLQPLVHYIPLKKDFSNLDDVLRLFRDRGLRRELTENAYRDLIASGEYSYRHFIESFDAELMAAGHGFEVDERSAHRVTDAYAKAERRRRRFARLDALVHRPFPGRRAVSFVLRPVVKRAREWLRKAKLRGGEFVDR